MSCTYTFTGKLPEMSSVLTFNTSAGSIEELLELLLDLYNLYGFNFKDDFISSDFLFYDTGKTASEVIDAAAQAFKDNKKILDKDNTVTGQASILAYGPTGKASPKSLARSTAGKQLLDIIYSFRREFGTIIHKFILNELEGTGNSKTIKLLEIKLKEAHDKLSPSVVGAKDDLEYSEQDLLVTLLKLYDWNIHKDKDSNKKAYWDSYITEILNTARLIRDHYDGCKIHSEIEISLKKRDSSAKLLYGSSDLIVEKPDGTIVIVDFKTSLTQATGPRRMSNATKLYHYALLEAYRKILESHGYKAKDIKGENLLITFNSAGISCDLTNPDYIVDPEAELVGGKEKAIVRKMLSTYFPAETIETVDKEIIDAILEKLEHFCSGMMLKRWQTESLKNSIIKAAKNKNLKYMYSNSESSKLCRLEIVGDPNSENPIIAGFVDSEPGPKKVFEKDLNTLVKDELNSVKEDTAALAEEIFIAILNKDVNALKHFINKESRTKERRALWGNLYKYCSENYTMIECPELLKLGIIVVKHLTRGYELIVLSSESSNLEFSNDPSESILKGVFGEDNYKEARKYIDKYKESKEMLRPSIGNMYAMRAFIALSELKDKVATFKDGKLIGINVVSVTSGASTGLVSTDQLKKTSMVLLQVCKEATNIDKREHFTDLYDKVKSIEGYSTTELWELMLVDSLLVCAEEYSMQDSLKWDLSKTENIDLKLTALDNLIAIMESNPEIKKELAAMGTKSTDRGKVGAENESSAVRVYLLIKAVRAKLRDNLFIENPMNNVSINYQEAIVNGINLLTKGSILKYTKNGLMLTGLAQGLAASNAYASPSKLIQRFLHFYDVATGRMLKQLLDELTELNKATEKFIELRKKSSLIDKIVGNHNDIYKGLFALDANGKVSKDMLFLNPYDPNCKLTKEEKDYLEIVLWSLNRRRMVLGANNALYYQSLSYREFKKSDQFENYKLNIVNNSKYLQVPLKLREGASGIKSGLTQILTSDKKVKDFAKEELARCRAMIERELLDEHQLSMRDKAIDKKTYINYFEENSESRVTRTENKNAEDWDWNVNSLCVEYALADLKSVYFKDLLSVADDLFAAIAIIEDMTGLDLTNQTEELFNRIQVSIYNKNLISPEWQDVVAGLGVAKSAMALTKIAVRPALLMKEMLLGRIRNTAAILADLIHLDEGHEISMKHLTDAAMEVFGANFLKEGTYKMFGKYPSGHKSIASKLNDVYAINDRDLSVIGDKFSYDSYGLHNFASRMLYVNTIAPDWFNRMIIFIAKMKADGCYNAHHLNEETGELEYDISKDERVNYYWAHRDTPNMNDEKFLRLKAYFIEKMRLFEQDGWRNPDNSKLVYGDLEINPSKFPRAYTTTEEESAKELIGLIYGYYSHQERATYLKGLWYNLQTAFLTFLPAEVRKAFATGRETSIYVTRQEKDLEGKPLYWKKSKEGELTEKTTAKTDESTGLYLAPVMETVPDPYVGTITSTCKVIGLLCNKDYDALKRDPRLVKQMEVLLFNTLFAMFVAAIMAALANSGVKTVSSEIVGSTIKKAANELDFYHAVLEPVSGFHLVGVDYLNNVFSSSFNAITSENYSLLDFANENFAIVKDLHLNALLNV